MPIVFPPDRNYLVAGIHTATVEDVRTALVDAFPDSTTRQEIFDQWRSLTEEIQALVPIEYQWLDGSFVSKKTNPNDLDLATTYIGLEADDLNESARADFTRLLSGPNNERYPRVDSWPTPQYPTDHPAHDWLEANRQYFRDGMFAQDDRLPNPIAKGFVEVRFA